MKLLPVAPVGRAASVGGMGCGASSARHTPNFALAEPPPEPRAPQTPPSPQTPPAGTQSRAFDGALADDPQSAAAEEQAAEEGACGKDAIDLDVLDDPAKFMEDDD